MVFNREDILTLKHTLAVFDPGQPITRDHIRDTQSLQRYLEHFSLLNISSGDYHLGYFTLPVEPLAKWGRITCHWWRNPDTSLGTVCFAPGLFDHAGLFQPLFAFLIAQGFDVVCLEMPGHGLSDGSQCAVDSFHTYAAIWQLFLETYQQHFKAPLIGMGQSTGCTIFTSLALRTSPPILFSRLVFLAPLVRPQRWLQAKTSFTLMGKFIKKVPRGLRINSHCDKFNHLLFNDILQPEFLSVQWVAALMNWVRYLPKLGHSDWPLLIVQGTEDKVVDFSYNLPALQKHFTAHQTIYLDNARHHLANEAEPWQTQLFARVSEFIHD